MRMGAIFARGSCRALKWTAMLGVVFALGAGSAAAQITASRLRAQEGDAADNGDAKVSYPEGAIGARHENGDGHGRCRGSDDDNTYGAGASR